MQYTNVQRQCLLAAVVLYELLSLLNVYHFDS